MNKLVNYFAKRSLLRNIKKVQKSDAVWGGIDEILSGINHKVYYSGYIPHGYFIKTTDDDLILVVDENFKTGQFTSDIGYQVDGKEIGIHVIPGIASNTLSFDELVMYIKLSHFVESLKTTKNKPFRFRDLKTLKEIVTGE